MDFAINFITLVCFGLWLYSIFMDYYYNRPFWAFINFIIFPVGIVRGLYLTFEGY